MWKEMRKLDGEGRVVSIGVLLLTCGELYSLLTCVGAPPLVPRVLDVSESQLCIIIGTVYMDMPNKPNVMEDLGKDVCSCYTTSIGYLR